jgi:hypothetical protein
MRKSHKTTTGVKEEDYKNEHKRNDKWFIQIVRLLTLLTQT